MQFGLIGPSYQSQSVNADCQICRNWYVEILEDQGSKVRRALYPSPGLKVFSTLAGMAQVRREFFFAGRHFAVAERGAPSAQVLFEVFADGTNVQRGDLGPIGSQPSFAVNQANQLMVASGGRLFLFNLASNKVSEIDTTTGIALQGPVAKIDFTTGFFVALLQNSQKWQISAVEDGSKWDPLDISAIEGFSDSLVGMVVDHGEISFLGPKQSAVYFNSGNPDFPFQPTPGGFIESGISAPDSITKLDNSVFWIGGDERGAGIAFRSNGYTPQRISTFAIENEWQGYATVADAIGYAFQDRGHAFWHVYFPTANKSWRYDVAVGMWHQVDSLDGSAHKSQCHAYAFGKHLVGARDSGNIYEMSGKYFDDAGTAIQRVRRSPHVGIANMRLTYAQLLLLLETGLGPQPPLLDGQGHPRGPQIWLRWSDDGGHTWSNAHMIDCGQAGEFKRRAVWRRLGRTWAWQRVFEISASDPVPWRIVGEDLEAA